MEGTREDSSSTSSEGPRVICDPRENDRTHAEGFDWDTAIKIKRSATPHQTTNHFSPTMVVNNKTLELSRVIGIHQQPQNSHYLTLGASKTL